MHFEFLLEEPSAEVFLRRLLPKVLGGTGAGHTWELHPHEGKADLMQKLPERLRAYARFMQDDWRIVVLFDKDRADCAALKATAVMAATQAGVCDRALICVAVEELEAWYLGDPDALRAAYPRLPAGLTRRRGLRDPDSVRGGTWEALDRALRSAGYSQGLAKMEAASLVGSAMDPFRNTSPSFRYFRDGVLRLAGVCKGSRQRQCKGETA